MAPRICVIIPIYNEAALLEVALGALLDKLSDESWSFEIILAQNGSTDQTPQLADRLAEEHDTVRVTHTSEPNYGRALREGIESAQGEIVICDEIDLCDVDFYRRALRELETGTQMVVGSKRHPESQDSRPWIRRRGTQAINGLLRMTLGFTGTDTHGLKAFERETLLPVVRRCTVEHDLFASELVIRAMREGIRVVEIPLNLRELRPPSVALLKRVPRVMRNLARLVITIRFS